MRIGRNDKDQIALVPLFAMGFLINGKEAL